MSFTAAVVAAQHGIHVCGLAVASNEQIFGADKQVPGRDLSD